MVANNLSAVNDTAKTFYTRDARSLRQVIQAARQVEFIFRHCSAAEIIELAPWQPSRPG